MSIPLIRTVAIGLLLATLSACSGMVAHQPAAPTTDVNPITGSRGGSAS